MRKHRVLVLIGTLILSLLPLSHALAVPSLQLDIDPGVYDWSTGTIVSTSDTFTLYALLRPNFANTLHDTYYISAALLPKTPDGSDLGSFDFNGGTINVTSGMYYGVPPLEANLSKDPGDLPQHGIFPTYFREFSFGFAEGSTTASYNTQTGAPANGLLYYRAFEVNTSNLSAGYAIHFDLYNTRLCRPGDIDIEWFAPFSHDAESRQVPEPGTMMLLGSGLIGLAALGRKKSRR